MRTVNKKSPGLLPGFSQVKRVQAWQIAEGMKAKGVTKTLMASQMKTDRRQLDPLLDPANKSVTLGTFRRAATALGRKLYVAIG